MVTTGDGMLIQLRKDEVPRPGSSSSGFEGAERLDLNKNVHVVMHDVGKSGLMPGLACAATCDPSRLPKPRFNPPRPTRVKPSRNHQQSQRPWM